MIVVLRSRNTTKSFAQIVADVLNAHAKHLLITFLQGGRALRPLLLLECHLESHVLFLNLAQQIFYVERVKILLSFH